MESNANPSSSPAPLEWLPLTEAVSFQMLQEHLAGRSSPEVLAQLGQWLAELVQHEQYPLERWLDAMEQIERLAELHQFRLVPQRLAAPSLQKLCESELWQATQAYWRQLDDAYLHCLLRKPAAEGEGRRERQDRLAPILSRLMRNLARQHKGLLLAGKRIEERIWRDLGHGYLLAESLGLSDPPLRQEMLKLLMLAVATPDALPPIQLHIAERITASLAGYFAFGNSPGPACGFCFELGAQRPPARWQQGMHPPASGRLRFFGAGSALQALQGLADQLRRRGSLPPQTALGGEFQPADILAAIQQLEHQWSDTRPARRDAREAARTRLTVVPGLMPALGWLAQQQPEGRLEPPRSPRTEQWDASDRSEHGFGTTLPDGPPGWLTVGALMAVEPEAGAAMRMGMVRRITVGPDGRSHIGVELLGQQAARVTLHPDLPRQSGGSMPAGQAAILLSPHDARTDAAELLLPAGILEGATRLQMQLGADSYRLESPVTIAQGRDYRQVRYSLGLAA